MSVAFLHAFSLASSSLSGLFLPLLFSLLSSLCCSSASVVLLTAGLLAHNHPGDVDVVGVKEFLGLGDGGDGKGPGAGQDPGEVHMEQPQHVGAGVDHGCVVVVSRQDPVWRVGQNCGQ